MDKSRDDAAAWSPDHKLSEQKSFSFTSITPWNNTIKIHVIFILKLWLDHNDKMC